MKKCIVIILFTLFIQSVNALTEAPIDVLSMSINEIQEARSKNIITYEQLTKIYLDRINEYNKIYNSYITINDKAIDEAKAMDKLYEEKGLISKMMGIPIAVKDNIDVYGMPTTAGTKSLSDNYPNKDADVIKKLRDAGTIFLGKTNMSELAFSARISKSSYGHTYNAYNTKYTPYGSSGGSASVVGSALAVAALGTDTSASIRTPSSANNAYGLRPTTSFLIEAK